jgi:outer membrane protein assembly factor BamB
VGVRAKRLSAPLCLIGLLLAACGPGSNHAAESSTSTAPVTNTSTPTNSTARATTSTVPPAGDDAWTTYYHDGARSGATSNGPSSPSAVKQRWISPALDGDVYAQPLLAGARVIIATENDSVYALDRADGKVLWRRHLGEPVAGSSLPCGDVSTVGITSTPVIDASAGRVYAAGMVAPGRHLLFALDLSTGKVIASVGVDATGADPSVHNQRAALTLSGGRVFVPFGGRFGDCGDYHGQVVSARVTPSGFGAVASYTLPTQREGGFWAPPGAATASDGSLYITSGNSSSSGQYDHGNSVVRLGASLNLLDSFAPTDWASLNAGDVDLGSTSPVLLPGGRVFQIGKSGVGYLLDAAHLGGIGGQLHSGTVCSSRAFGGVAHRGNTLYVPCGDGITEVTVQGDGFSVGWSASASVPGPPIVASGAVWSVATASGDLIAIDAQTGKQLTVQHLGAVPSRFVSPAAASKLVVAAAGRTVFAFGD